MTLPRVFPIFPLDQVILVPGAMLPLHIFEPRYRDMVADALAGDRSIAMGMPANQGQTGAGLDPQLHPVCGLGRIVHHQQYPDGRSDILLEGLSRMMIEAELDSGKSYRVVRAGRLEEIVPADDVTERASLLLSRAMAFDDDECALLAKLPLGRMLDSVLLRIPVPMNVKQEIFAAAHLGDRLDALEVVLDKLDEPPSLLCFDADDPRLN